ncbi:MAG TPA: flagellar biosynthesis protein FlhF, partial [Burkholderiaceae bacterium]|nr:flagellar biosynthesis protein FlhF [Burkholderiaceae bacterium]
MNVKRFVGRTSREAMRKLRDALGPDALVLANRPCAEGVELLAAAPDALGTLNEAPAPAPARAARPAAPAPVEPAYVEEAPEPAAAAPMSTVSFQDYVRQRLRERNKAASPQGTAGLAATARAA